MIRKNLALICIVLGSAILIISSYYANDTEKQNEQPSEQEIEKESE